MNRLNLILAGFAALLLAVWLVKPAPPPPPPLISALQADAIRSLQLFSGAQGQAGVQLQRNDGHWHLIHPIQAPADDFMVGQILRIVQAPSSRQYASEELDRVKLKLEPPLWRVIFDQDEFLVGASAPLNRQRYVQHGDTIHLIPDFNPARLDGNYADLVSRRLLEDNEVVLRLRLEDELYHRTEQGWEDSQGRARPGIEALFARWQQAEAQWVVRPTQSDFAAVTRRAILHTDRRSIDYLISQVEPELRLIRPDWDVLYNLPGSASAELLTAPPPPSPAP